MKMIDTPSLLQPADEIEEVELLLRRERGGRLVEDDQPRRVVHGAGDLHHLLLPAPSEETSAIGSTWKLSDSRKRWAWM